MTTTTTKTPHTKTTKNPNTSTSSPGGHIDSPHNPAFLKGTTGERWFQTMMRTDSPDIQVTKNSADGWLADPSQVSRAPDFSLTDPSTGKTIHLDVKYKSRMYRYQDAHGTFQVGYQVDTRKLDDYLHHETSTGEPVYVLIVTPAPGRTDLDPRLPESGNFVLMRALEWLNEDNAPVTTLTHQRENNYRPCEITFLTGSMFQEE